MAAEADANVCARLRSLCECLGCLGCLACLDACARPCVRLERPLRRECVAAGEEERRKLWALGVHVRERCVDEARAL